MSDDLDPKKLKKAKTLYDNDENFRKALNYAAKSYSQEPETDLRLLEQAIQLGWNGSREFARQVEEDLDFGRYIRGRRGGSTRIQWRHQPDVIKSAIAKSGAASSAVKEEHTGGGDQETSETEVRITGPQHIERSDVKQCVASMLGFHPNAIDITITIRL